MGYFSTASSKQSYTVLTGSGGVDRAPPSGTRSPSRRVRVPGQRAFRSLRGWVTSCWGNHGGNRLSSSGSGSRSGASSNGSSTSKRSGGGGGGARGSMISIIEGREPFAGRRDEEEEEEYNDKMLLLDEECDGSGFLGFGVRDGRGVVFEERGGRC